MYQLHKMILCFVIFIPFTIPAHVEKPGFRSIEKYFPYELGKSAAMIEDNVDGSKEDFLSSFGYRNKFKEGYDSVFIGTYSGRIYCRKTKGSFSLRILKEKDVFSLSLDSPQKKITGTFETSDFLFSDNLQGENDLKSRFFINGKNIKIKGIIVNDIKGGYRITWMRLMDSSGKVCGILATKSK